MTAGERAEAAGVAAVGAAPVRALPTGRRRTVVLVIVLLAAFMDLLDATIANIALPTVRRELGASAAQAEWVLAGYTLAFALSVVTGARLGDVYGCKRVFVVGMGGFTVASALCGAAPSPGLLVAARVVQGVFGAAMIPQVLSQIQLLYAPRERGRAMAAFSSLSGLAAALGPILGALLLESATGLGWRAVFWVNVPVGAVAVVAARRVLPERRGGGRARLDLAGVALSGVGLLLVLYPLSTASDRGQWPVWAYGGFAAGVVVLGVFYRHQRVLSDRERDPLVEVALFRIRSAAGGLLVEFLVFLPMMGFFFTLLQLLQGALGFSPLTVGVLMLAWPVANVACATFGATVLLPRWGRGTVQCGLVVMAAGLVVLAWTAQGAGAGTVWAVFVPGVLVTGCGAGLAVAPLAQFTLHEVPERHAASGSSLFNITIQVAASLGVALFGTLYFRPLADAGRPAPAVAGGAFADTLWVSAGVLGVALAASWLLPARTAGAAGADA